MRVLRHMLGRACSNPRPGQNELSRNLAAISVKKAFLEKFDSIDGASELKHLTTFRHMDTVLRNAALAAAWQAYARSAKNDSDHFRLQWRQDGKRARE